MITDSERLIARTPEDFSRTGIKVRLHTPVSAINPERKTVALSSGETLAFDCLVVATGASPRLPGVSGEDSENVFRLRSVADAVRIKDYIKGRKAKRAAVVGAGFVSLEICEAFRRLGLQTTLINRDDFPMRKIGKEFGELIARELKNNGVILMQNAALQGMERTDSGGINVSTNKGSIETDLVLMGIGVAPEVSLAKEAGIALGPTGAIAVNERMQTNVDFIYAAGDCSECRHRVSRRPVHFPLGDIANKQGRVAGSNIGGREAVFPGIVGSYCLKVFGLEVAGTGMTMDDVRSAGMKAQCVAIEGESRAHSYPGGGSLKISLVGDSENGRLLGAQAIGGEGAVSRINALAAGLTTGITVEELAYLDFAYAPPFSGAWDPIHIAARQLLKRISPGRKRD